jgi:hypothetical protein
VQARSLYRSSPGRGMSGGDSSAWVFQIRVSFDLCSGFRFFSSLKYSTVVLQFSRGMSTHRLCLAASHINCSHVLGHGGLLTLQYPARSRGAGLDFVSSPGNFLWCGAGCVFSCSRRLACECGGAAGRGSEPQVATKPHDPVVLGMAASLGTVRSRPRRGTGILRESVRRHAAGCADLIGRQGNRRIPGWPCFKLTPPPFALARGFHRRPPGAFTAPPVPRQVQGQA